MISSPWAVLTFLVALTLSLVALSEQPRTARFFRVPPVLLWIYLLPTVASTLGIVPRESPLYGLVVEWALPAALVLLLLAVDLLAILRLGPTALTVMLAGAAGIFLGGPLVLLLLGDWLPAEAWSGIGALSASWIGGSANMIAVKESLGTPEPLFLQLVLFDALLAYAWMALLIALAPLQGRFDRFTRARVELLEIAGRRLLTVEAPGRAARDTKPGVSLAHLPLLLLIAAAGSAVAHALGGALPVVPRAVTAYTWTIVVVTGLGVALSLTPARRLEQRGASRVGTLLLYFVLACIGARADLRGFSDAPVLLCAGASWLALHGMVLIAATRVLRSPLFFAAAASQACVGGPASAPIVAAAYQPHLSEVGLLLAVLGNVSGTYLGLVCGRVCRALARG